MRSGPQVTRAHLVHRAAGGSIDGDHGRQLGLLAEDGSSCQAWGWGRFAVPREPHSEPCTSLDRGFHLDRATVGKSDLPHDVETQSKSTAPTRLGRRSAPERLEELAQYLRRNGGAEVGHFENGDVAALAAQRHFYGPRRVPMVERIGQ